MRILKNILNNQNKNNNTEYVRIVVDGKRITTCRKARNNR